MNTPRAMKFAFVFSFWMMFAGWCQAASPAGRWKGEWSSPSSGHQGPMRANIRPNSNGTYSALFAGRFFKIIPFAYRVDLVPARDGSSGYVADKRLGPLLGSYKMQAQFSSHRMNGRFQAVGDQGSVRMKRL
ncbi:hypothetical protein [Neorhodopirellula pilleata]|uniref:SH3b domain-containing protein n=1 Tax=Neorhodopirellula pilleata TaxID=2714738 RepID=A0A5C6A2W8_9BACT|nr:hypothetical protein [Neorhodopirellula pilleata]TWT93541.1 hypothetical protein Pla100_40590 [Neorhodopirellula pilleata]